MFIQHKPTKNFGLLRGYQTLLCALQGRNRERLSGFTSYEHKHRYTILWGFFSPATLHDCLAGCVVNILGRSVQRPAVTQLLFHLSFLSTISRSNIFYDEMKIGGALACCTCHLFVFRSSCLSFNHFNTWVLLVNPVASFACSAHKTSIKR